MNPYNKMIFFYFLKKNFSAPHFEKKTTFLGIFLHSQVQLPQKNFPMKLITFPSHTSNFKEIKVKLTLGDHDLKHQKPLRALGVNDLSSAMGSILCLNIEVYIEERIKAYAIPSDDLSFCNSKNLNNRNVVMLETDKNYTE